MNFNLRWGAVLAGLVILSCSTVSVAAAQQEKSKPAAAPTKSATKKPEAAGTDKDKNPPNVDLVVPTDASPGKLMKFVDDVMYMKQPELDSPAELAAHYQKVVEAVMQASQIVLDTKGVDEGFVEKALNAQFMALALKTRLGGKKAIQERLDLAEKYREHPRPALARIAMEQRLYANLQRFDTLKPKEQEDLLSDALDFIKSTTQIDAQLIKRTAMIGNVFERAKTAGLSAKAYEQIAEVLSQTGRSDVIDISKQFQRMAKRMRLVGQPFEMEGLLISKEPIDWASYRGKVVLVYYWATWSVPSVTDLPNLKSLYQGYSSKGFDIIGVSKDTNMVALERFIAKNQITWSNLYNFSEEEEEQPIAQKYGVVSIPYRVLVDKDGKVIKLNPTSTELSETLLKLLGPPVEKEKKAEAKSEAK